MDEFIDYSDELKLFKNTNDGSMVDLHNLIAFADRLLDEITEVKEASLKYFVEILVGHSKYLVANDISNSKDDFEILLVKLKEYNAIFPDDSGISEAIDKVKSKIDSFYNFAANNPRSVPGNDIAHQKKTERFDPEQSKKEVMEKKRENTSSLESELKDKKSSYLYIARYYCYLGFSVLSATVWLILLWYALLMGVL